MQLYALSLGLTLALLGARRAAWLLLALLLLALGALGALAWAWALLPTFVMHRPE